MVLTTHPLGAGGTRHQIRDCNGADNDAYPPSRGGGVQIKDPTVHWFNNGQKAGVGHCSRAEITNQ